MIERFEQEIGNRGVVGTLFNSKKEEKSSTLIILLHGFLASKEDLYFLAKEFAREGFDALCIDLYGHGETQGEFKELTISKCVNDIHEIISSFREMKSYSKYSLLGYSIGGYIALSYCLKHNGITSSVLCAPVSDFKELFKQADIKEWKESNMLKDIELGININLNYEFYKDGIEIFNYKKAHEIKNKTLIIHGSNDSVVPYEQSIKLNETLQNSTLYLIDNGEHDNIFSMDEDIIKIILDFLK